MGQHFKDLVVWQKAMEMVTEVYNSRTVFQSERCMVSPTKYAVQQCLFQAILLKARRTIITVNLCISCATHQARWLSLKPN